MNTLLCDIESFLVRHEMSPTAFSERAAGDRHFVRRLRTGRDFRNSTETRVRAFMVTHDALAESAAA
jgi:hypothetical protein